MTCFNASSASPKMTPCPQTMSGFLALLMYLAASATLLESTLGTGV